MAQQMTAGNACPDPIRQQKHSALISLYYEVNEVALRVRDLNVKLGVYNGKPQEAKAVQPKDDPDPDTLVEVIDRLPGMLNGKVSELHNLLSELEDSLI